jgi:DNA-binding transcriptional activator of the SARP family
MPAPLMIRLFGPLQVLVHGEPMPRVRSRSIEWLLALLVLRAGQRVSRTWLAGTLWPDSEEIQSLQNLRNALLSLRQALGDEAARIVSPTRDTLTLDLDGVDSDLKTFDDAIRRGGEMALRDAVSNYTGLLLEGCFEEWVLLDRENRHQACLHALESLAQIAEERGDYAEALGHLRRAEGMDALRDNIQRALMRVLSRSGDTPAALFVYREYRQRLRREMNVEPDEETTRLFREIRELGAQPRAPRPNHPVQAPTQYPTLPPRTHEEHSIRLAPLPHPLTALIGREGAVREVSDHIRSSRLVTLVGGGGVGKTRLSIQAAVETADDFC